MYLKNDYDNISTNMMYCFSQCLVGGCLLEAGFLALRAADVNNKKHIKQHFLSFRNENETIPRSD